MFKRPRLRPPFSLVNASLAASVVFLAACSGSETEPPEKAKKNNAPVTLQENANQVELQAVWATGALDSAITGLAFVGGSEPMLAASLSSGALQFFDLQGDRITQAVDLNVKEIASGQAVVLGGAAITLFPGISQSGDLDFYAYAPALGEPLRLDFLPDQNAKGLCAGPPLSPDHVMQLAFWTEDAPTILSHGHVGQDAEGNLSWTLLDQLSSANGPITACAAFAELEIATAATGVDLAAIEKFGQRYLLAQTTQGDLNVIDTSGVTRQLTIADGITVRTPSPPAAIAALSDAQFGNYPDGLLVVGGTVNGVHQITLIEPGALFRSK